LEPENFAPPQPGKRLFAGGEQPEAIAQCQLAISLDHNNAAAYYLAGCACFAVGQATNAVTRFQQSQKSILQSRRSISSLAARRSADNRGCHRVRNSDPV
jgi:Flp pilus assembly protein TadD